MAPLRGQYDLYTRFFEVTKSIDTTTGINQCLLFFFSNILRSEILPLSIATDFYSTF
jgi:hypothetical protein